MSEYNENVDPAEEESEQIPQEHRYRPRPKWQLVLAWVLLAALILSIILYYYWIAYPSYV